MERINDNTFRSTSKYADVIFRTDTNSVTVTLKMSSPMDIATTETIIRNLVNYALFVVKWQPTHHTPGKSRFYPDTLNQGEFCDSIFYELPAVKLHGQEETYQWTYEIMQQLSNYRSCDFLL
jgi:hypothetical protein